MDANDLTGFEAASQVAGIGRAAAAARAARAPGMASRTASAARVAAAFLAVSAGLTQSVAADANPDLYTATAIVTGTDLRAREEGLRRIFETVAIKLTGDPALAGSRQVAELADGVDAMVEDILYLDRETDEVNHDEQGTRDRPFDLVAHLDPGMVDRALSAAGLRVWTARRPTLFALVSVRKGGSAFMMAADGEDGERQRQALAAAATRFGMRFALPLADEADDDAQRLAAGRDARGKLATGEQVLVHGTLAWSEADFGWVGTWTLSAGGKDRTWEIRGVSFDEAFRSLVGGSAARLATAR